jgi:hypothetical protein
VLGVGSIPSVTLGANGYQSQSTKVPENGAYILAEDQNGVESLFGSSNNYFDYGSGTKNTIAQTSENFVTAEGYFSTEEQGSLVSQQLTGVCISSSGCNGSYGVQTSINSYKLYPMSSADVYYGITGSRQLSDGYFFTKDTVAGNMTGAKVSTATPVNYWLRSPVKDMLIYATDVFAGNGQWDISRLDGSEGAYGFRPAGVLNL